ncbi:hypothetical protein LB452_07315 [Psychroflexus sp. CAK8W]|uniref:Uncharacterized protein n=1 Tax=Psychroflexus longus TaxID=2873596 RepID=A0ABS7XK03_9FLAO|nr:hypothetical protein [Psychroflexus longus]MBZ9778729.1 hypothetical protein [Psychroflexus longus]
MILREIREGWLGRHILVFLILVFINLSIDAPDIFLKRINYNEQETLIELIIEKGIGIEDAFSEQNHDHELPEKSASKKNHVDLFRTNLFENLALLNLYLECNSIMNYVALINSQDHSKIIIPPPEFEA